MGVKSPEDIVVVSALRATLTRGKKGGFKDVLADGKGVFWLIGHESKWL